MLLPAVSPNTSITQQLPEMWDLSPTLRLPPVQHIVSITSLEKWTAEVSFATLRTVMTSAESKTVDVAMQNCDSALLALHSDPYKQHKEK